ncbi:fungal specific transcription factor [Colletotrichum plurivorum]|uniref:Fungal specific transcription factor n=1 Tax=Colletotrichum plurivorum TaxID=2175906 RepID=A0A8H6KNF9_9PEZI|nr:fungal specific transcription factor [Colletotrichum plurivorum]
MSILASSSSIAFYSTAPGEQVPSSSLAFFSEQKFASLDRIIGDSRLRDVVKRLDDFILNRLRMPRGSPWPSISFDKSSKMEPVTREEADSYIRGGLQASFTLVAYFTGLHPVYPFLDRDEFEAEASSADLDDSLSQNPAFSALYHSILALGSHLLQGGSFQGGEGRSWELFQVAQSLMVDIILPRESIESVQALAAMSIYAMSSSALEFDEYFISHAARMAVGLRYHRNVYSEAKHLRVFWVIYALEKLNSMHSSVCSIIPDEDIGCVIPPFPEAQRGAFNWFIAHIKIARITSIVYESLFSISASLRSAELFRSSLDRVHRLLEDWRQSIPEDVRPGDSAHFPLSASSSVRLAALQLHFRYYQLIIAVERIALYINRDNADAGQASKQRLMVTARAVVEMTKHIDIQPHVPIFILAVLPVSAVFILFDLVIHNPFHRESRTNLSLLDTAAGYFSLVDIASNQALPGSILPEFAQIAREFFWKAQKQKNAAAAPSRPTESAPAAATASSEPGNLPTDEPQPAESTAPAELRADTPKGSDYLEYPTPLDFEGASDFHAGDSADFRAVFGWALPDWYAGAAGISDFAGTEGEIDVDALDFHQPLI